MGDNIMGLGHTTYNFFNENADNSKGIEMRTNHFRIVSIREFYNTIADWVNKNTQWSPADSSEVKATTPARLAIEEIIQITQTYAKLYKQIDSKMRRMDEAAEITMMVKHFSGISQIITSAIKDIDFTGYEEIKAIIDDYHSKIIEDIERMIERSESSFAPIRNISN